MTFQVLRRRVAAAVLLASTMSLAGAPVNAQAFLSAGEAAAPPRGAFALCAEDQQTCGIGAEPAGVSETGTNPVETAGASEKPNGLKVAATPGSELEQSSPSEPATVQDEQVMAMAQVINSRINAVMRYRTDMSVWGVEERWVRPLGQYSSRFGDCEDFALEKRAALLEAGVPADRLRMAVAWSRRTGVHAVLIVRTADGDFVLDNTTTEIRRVDETGYQWRSVQSGSHLLAWSNAVLQEADVAVAS